MTIWIILALSAAAAALWIAWPFLRARSYELSGSEGAISVYRDQMDEVERDRDAGLISEAECAAALAEIERRALSAAREIDQGLVVSTRATSVALSVALFSAAAVLGIYAVLGTPEAPDQPLAERNSERLIQQANAGDINARIKLLIDRTKENPDSFEDWWTLAQSYAMIGDHASSADAYRHAANLAGDRPVVLSAYAEAMTLANGNKVPNAARVIFEQLIGDTGDPRARYYVALAKAQAQDFQGAIEDWAALARDSTPDAPWMPLVRRDIVNMARFLKADVTAFLPDATPDEIAVAGGSGLLPPSDEGGDPAERVAEDPTDFKGWMALVRQLTAEGDSEAAAQALERARSHFAGAPFVLQKFAELERELGLDLLAADARGPTREDMAAAAEMTQEERDDMVAGMVAGLAARLEEQPNDLDGWVMLVRSYSVMGEKEKARAAYETALTHFDNDQRAKDILRELSEDL